MSGARPDTQPGTSVPQGPSRTQPETNNQKELASKSVAYHPGWVPSTDGFSFDRLGVQGRMPVDPTKGQASDVISSKLNSNSGSSGSGAAPDNSPGEPFVPS